ncbi:hypothetical protein Cgig2_002742 [Carnegiea gigantea]|uniref:3-hydroxyisobutyryl-CoA hydrolase n=1 Tax=Carnegiea gigantea TaxID=171969 RepID=A0A9Q1QCB0_9CARY|nr:hypothetical protein Cgig2_002742 [Carnegiea gigantea]
MAQAANTNEPVVLGEQVDHVRLITLNRPRQLNVISPETVTMAFSPSRTPSLGAGRAFSAGGDLRVFYEGRKQKDYCLEVVYRMYWLCYHIHTYKKTQVALVNGIAMVGGASLMVPMEFSVVTEKTVFATPEAGIRFHTNCGFSYLHSRLPGHLGEFFALTGARLNGKELVAAGLATHYVPSEVDEAEALKGGNAWISPVLTGLKRSSPTGLKITLRSVLISPSFNFASLNTCFIPVREARNKTLAECLKAEFRLTMNILRSTVSGDVYEGIRALTIDKDNTPKWDLLSLNKVNSEDLDLVFKPFEAHLELQIPKKE